MWIRPLRNSLRSQEDRYIWKFYLGCPGSLPCGPTLRWPPSELVAPTSSSLEFLAAGPASLLVAVLQVLLIDHAQGSSLFLPKLLFSLEFSLWVI